MQAKKIISCSLLAICLLCSGLALAAESPVVMLKRVSRNMFVQLIKNQRRLKTHPEIIHRIVNNTLLPYIDVNRMGATVVGRNYWFKATPAQRKEFISQFKRLVINTYSAALSSFDNDRIYFYPLRGGYKNRQIVQVNSVLKRQTGQRVKISYHLINRSGQWRVYDFSIEGVSILQNYRSQFAGTLAQGGMPLLISKLRRYNRGKS